MNRKQTWQVFVLLFFLTGCITPVKNIVLEPAARELSSPEELPEVLVHEQIYWQDRFVYLDGVSVEDVPDAKLLEDIRVYSSPKFSHNGRYVAYVYGSFFNKIGLWNSVSNEHTELVDTSRDLPYDARIGSFAFTPEDDKVLFSFTWHGNDGNVYADLATIDITTRQVEQLNINGFQVAFYGLDTSLDGKWVVTDMVTLDSQICLLVNLEQRNTKCLVYEKGWYDSVNFTPDNNHIVYSHNKEIGSPSSILFSKIDGTENRILVSGLAKSAWIQLAADNEVVFIGTAYDNLTCSHVYIINQDGSDLRKLAYLGEECITDEGAPVVP
ncbi:MAG: hypothetical protein QY332_16790 [Anaerolineales bacterium]|nr:MAG: hypothetical protein QY332_16790 [Anaerolineales bacterium]